MRTVRGSHTAVFEARVVEPGQTGVDPVGTSIPIESGDVVLDASAAVRSSVDLATPGKGMWPSPSDLLGPYGNELFVRRGIYLGGGRTEWVSLGYHRIRRDEQDDAPDGPIRIAAQDRMANITRARLLAPKPFGPGETYGSVVA